MQTKLETLSGEQEAATIKEDDKALAKIHKQAANLTARFVLSIPTVKLRSMTVGMRYVIAPQREGYMINAITCGVQETIVRGRKSLHVIIERSPQEGFFVDDSPILVGSTVLLSILIQLLVMNALYRHTIFCLFRPVFLGYDVFPTFRPAVPGHIVAANCGTGLLPANWCVVIYIGASVTTGDFYRMTTYVPDRATLLNDDNNSTNTRVIG